MKKFIILLLIAVIAAGVLVFCGENTDAEPENPDSIASPGEDDTETPAAEAVKIEPDLPEDLDFGGYTFTFLTHREDTAGWDWVTSDPREITAEEETGDPINDAVFRRNATLQAKYNFELDMITIADEVSMLRRAVNAGDDIYDAAMIYNNNVPGAVQNDLLTEISKLSYIDQDKPWWDPAANQMSIAGMNFLLAGDLMILDNEATNAMIFNKDMIADMALEVPYNLVTEGKWTMDALFDMVRDAGTDLNGDGEMRYMDDRFGLITFNDTLQALLISGGGAFAAKDEKDIPFMDFAGERNIAVLEKAMNLMYKDTNPSVFNVQSVDAGSGNVTWMAAYYNTFEENRALFMWIRMRVVEVFRGMEANFGILPMPKYDENQTSYRSLVNPYTGVMLGVPKSAGELDRTSMILEAISAESKYTLQPAYYEIVLTRQFTRDVESEAMLDIIFGSRIYDIGGVYSFGDVFSGFTDLASRENRDVASYYERRGPAMQTAIDRLVDRIENLE
ncbi:MAG: hypothetical protein FWH24_01785 [Oscillospiraceae bacterium]|nr:hypothetical protein [Oscillospiraceae bacterium]